MTADELASLLVNDWLDDFTGDSVRDEVGSDGVDWATAREAVQIAKGIIDTMRQRWDDE